MQHLEQGFKDKNIFLKPITVVVALSLSLLVIGPFITLLESLINFKSNFINFLLVSVFVPNSILMTIFIYTFRYLYKKSFIFSINGLKNIRWKRIFFGIYIWGIIVFCQILIGYFLDNKNYIINIELFNFLHIFLVCLIVFPIQCGFEEIFCRGYLLQVFGSWTNHRWISLVISSVVFGILHITNPEINSYGLVEMLVNYFCIGMIFGLVTIFDDGVEIAIGAHTANNIIACSIISFPSSVIENKNAIFYLQNVNVPSVLETIIGMCFTGLIFISILNKKYKWRPLNEISSKIL